MYFIVIVSFLGSECAFGNLTVPYTHQPPLSHFSISFPAFNVPCNFLKSQYRLYLPSYPPCLWNKMTGYDKLIHALSIQNDSDYNTLTGNNKIGKQATTTTTTRTTTTPASTIGEEKSKSGDPRFSTTDGFQPINSDLYSLPPISPTLAAQKPWKTDAKYFSKCKISSLALLKMCVHAQRGGSIEVMGMLVGKVVGRTIVVMDTYRLPVEGTETRVNAQGEAYEYMVQYLDLNKKAGEGNSTEQGQGQRRKKRDENIVGWYHSHPGYGCWLSGIDVSTQALNQNFQDPYLAIVVDPVKTLKLGKVDIGAFRTLPDGYMENVSGTTGLGSGSGSGSGSASTSAVSKSSKLQRLPKSKRAEFGSHANQYYSLDVEIFESPYDHEMLQLLANDDNAAWMKLISVDIKPEIKAFNTGDLKFLNYLSNFQVVDDGTSQDEEIVDIIKKLENHAKNKNRGLIANNVLKQVGSDFENIMYRKLLQGDSKEKEGIRTRRVRTYEEAEREDHDDDDDDDENDELMDESDLDKGDREGKELGRNIGSDDDYDYDDDDDDDDDDNDENAKTQDSAQTENDDDTDNGDDYDNRSGGNDEYMDDEDESRAKTPRYRSLGRRGLVNSRRYPSSRSPLRLTREMKLNRETPLSSTLAPDRYLYERLARPGNEFMPLDPSLVPNSRFSQFLGDVRSRGRRLLHHQYLAREGPIFERVTGMEVDGASRYTEEPLYGLSMPPTSTTASASITGSGTPYASLRGYRNSAANTTTAAAAAAANTNTTTTTTTDLMKRNYGLLLPVQNLAAKCMCELVNIEAQEKLLKQV